MKYSPKKMNDMEWKPDMIIQFYSLWILKSLAADGHDLNDSQEIDVLFVLKF